MFTTARLKSAVYNNNNNNNNNNNKTAIVLSLGGGSPYINTDKKIIYIYIYKGNNTKNIVQTIQNTLNTSTHTAKTPIQ